MESAIKLVETPLLSVGSYGESVRQRTDRDGGDSRVGRERRGISTLVPTHSLGCGDHTGADRPSRHELPSNKNRPDRHKRPILIKIRKQLPLTFFISHNCPHKADPISLLDHRGSASSRKILNFAYNSKISIIIKYSYLARNHDPSGSCPAPDNRGARCLRARFFERLRTMRQHRVTSRRSSKSVRNPHIARAIEAMEQRILLANSIPVTSIHPEGLTQYVDRQRQRGHHGRTRWL